MNVQELRKCIIQEYRQAVNDGEFGVALALRRILVASQLNTKSNAEQGVNSQEREDAE